MKGRRSHPVFCWGRRDEDSFTLDDVLTVIQIVATLVAIGIALF